MSNILIDRIFEDIVETISLPIVILDSNLHVYKTNRCFYDIFKIVPEEVIGNLIFKLGNGQWDIPKLHTMLNDIISKGYKFEDFHVEHKFPSIGRKIMLLNARRLIQNDTSPQMILLCIEDITEKEDISSALMASEERYRRVFETSDDAIFLLEKAEGKIVQTNPSAKKMLGNSKEQCIDKTLQEIGFLPRPNPIHEIVERLKNEDIIHFNDIQLTDKAGKNIDVDIYCVDKSHLIQCNIRDITVRKKAANSLKASEKKYRMLMENLSQGVWYIDQDAKTTYVNRPMADMLGYTSVEMLGKPLFEFMDKHSVKHCKRNLERRQHGIKEQHEFEFVRKDGSRLTALIETGPITDDNGRYNGAVASVLDITSRKRAEEERDRIFTLSSDLICIAGMDGYFKYVNPAWENLLGYTTKELLSRPFLDFIHPDDHRKNNEEVARLSEGKKTIGFENRYVCKNGSILHVQWTATPFPDEGKIYCIGRDVTERKLKTR